MNTISMRLTDDEKKVIQEKALQAGVSLSEFVRSAALGYEIHDDGTKQGVVKVMCTYHEKIDAAQSLEDSQKLYHQAEAEIYGIL